MNGKWINQKPDPALESKGEITKIVPRREKNGYAKTKMQISFAITAALISAFVFATWIVHSLFLLNPKFQVSSNLLWSYSLVRVWPGWKPRRPVFSQRGSIKNRQTAIRHGQASGQLFHKKWPHSDPTRTRNTAKTFRVWIHLRSLTRKEYLTLTADPQKIYGKLFG